MASKEKMCPFCEEVFNDTEIKAHIGIAHLSFENGDFIKEHAKSQFQCKECSMRFISKVSLERHVRLLHSKSQASLTPDSKVIKKNPSWKCNTCNKYFAAKASLNLHVKTIHQRIRFKCEECNETFGSYASRIDHVRSVHRGLDLPCPSCGKTFTKYQNFHLHLKSFRKGICGNKR